MLERLDELKLPRDTARALLQVGASSDSAQEEQAADVRVDIIDGAKGAIQFLNNLEKDAVYKRWPKSLKQLLFPSWQLHALARNLYTLVLVVDPTTNQGLEALALVQAMLQNMYPVRFGLVLTSQSAVDLASRSGGAACLSPDREAGSDVMADAADVVALFAEAKQRHTAKTAVDFLFSLATTVKAPFSRQDLIESYAAAVAGARGSWSKASYATEASKALDALVQGAGADVIAEVRAGPELLCNMTRYVAIDRKSVV